MIFTVPIKIVVEDNPHNPPEAKSVAKTFVLKVPRSCALNLIREKIFRHHPIVQNLASAIYFQSDGEFSIFPDFFFTFGYFAMQSSLNILFPHNIQNLYFYMYFS